MGKIQRRKQVKFLEFIGLVDRMVEKEMGVSIYDLPDVDWHAFWFVGISEEDAKEKAMQCVAEIKESLDGIKIVGFSEAKSGQG